MDLEPAVVSDRPAAHPVELRDHLPADETRSTVMTSNRPLEDWGKLLGDLPAATAIFDRFLRRAEIISIPGRSCSPKDRPAKDGQTSQCPDKTETAVPVEKKLKKRLVSRPQTEVYSCRIY